MTRRPASRARRGGRGQTLTIVRCTIHGDHLMRQMPGRVSASLSKEKKLFEINSFLSVSFRTWDHHGIILVSPETPCVSPGSCSVLRAFGSCRGSTASRSGRRPAAEQSLVGHRAPFFFAFYLSHSVSGQVQQCPAVPMKGERKRIILKKRIRERKRETLPRKTRICLRSRASHKLSLAFRAWTPPQTVLPLTAVHSVVTVTSGYNPTLQEMSRWMVTPPPSSSRS